MQARSTAVMAVLALAIGGCAFKPQLQRVAVDQNQLVADTTNQLVLTNILRASERQPLHFTSIGKLTGNVQITALGNMGGDIRNDDADTVKTGPQGGLIETSRAEGTDLYKPFLQGQVMSNSTIDVGVHDTQEFYQGMTGSVPASLIAHYLRQGWPEELLTYLLVGSVDFVARDEVRDATGAVLFKQGEVVATLDNDPWAPAGFAEFATCYQLAAYTKKANDSRLVNLRSLGPIALADLITLDGDKYDLVIDPDHPEERWIVRKGRATETLTLKRDAGCQQAAKSEEDAKAKALTEPQTPQPRPRTTPLKSAGSGLAVDMELFGVQAAPPARSREPSAAADGGLAIAKLNVGRTSGGMVSVETDIHLVLRSTDGLIYYVGEYLRAGKVQGGRPPFLMKGYDQTQRPLFVATTERPKRAFAMTRFEGRTYYIPAGDEGGRSSQVVALIEQMMNLQKSAKDRPTTQTVRVVQ